MDRAELMRTDGLLVRSISGGAGDTLVVTFGSYTDNPDLDRAGFGEHVLQAGRIDAIHVVNRDNDWYQRREMAAVLSLIAARARGYRRVFTYGSSMGGYAAIRFAGAVGAQTAIAIAPQYSVDPAVVAEEARWTEAAGIGFLVERRGPIAPISRTIVFYDPMEWLDRLHVDRIDADTPVTRVGIPHAGHMPAVYLAELGLLSRVLFEIVEERFDPVAFRVSARGRRREAAKYFAVLSDRCTTHHPGWALSLARQAVALRPDDAGHWHNLAERLASLGHLVEAASCDEQAARLDPDCLLYPKMRALFLLRHGDTAASRTVLLTLIDRQPAVADHYHLVASSLGREGRIDEAIGFARKAAALDGTHPYYRRYLKRLRRKRVVQAILRRVGVSPSTVRPKSQGAALDPFKAEP